jgi:NADPH:quinone reductase-like Zn-dependent oxidoreductase
VDEAVDYTTTRFEEVVRDVDVVLDTVGGDAQERSWGVLKPGGMLVSIVQPPSAEMAAACGVQQQFVGAFPPAGGVLHELAALVEVGQVKPIVSSVVTLPEVRQAHALVEGKHVRGKVVVKVAD